MLHDGDGCRMAGFVLATGRGVSRGAAMSDHGWVPTGTSTDKAAALLALHAGPVSCCPTVEAGA